MTATARDAIWGYAKRQLIGPGLDEPEVLMDLPTDRYVAGTLYPQEQENTGHLEAQEEEQQSGDGAPDESNDDPVSLANQWMPSALGLSFFLAEGDSVDVQVWAGRYENAPDVEEPGERWVRHTIASENQPETVTISVADAGARKPVLESFAWVHSVWRELAGGYLVTVTVLSARQGKPSGRPKPEEVLFQVGLSCRPRTGSIREYPRADSLAGDEEEEELWLRHSHARVFAIGHGCAAMWDTAGRDSVDEVFSSVLPSYRMSPTVVAGNSGSEALSINAIADTEVPPARIVKSMREFVRDYEAWVRDLSTHVDKDSPSIAGAFERIERRHEVILAGVREGIGVLERDPDVMRAFRLANLAILVQMTHSDVINKGKTVSDPARLPEEFNEKSWHPFQLAFQLLVIPSLVDPESSDRDVVDLIWFPTGGGKTEAYLAVAAFEIFRRRLVAGARGAGTTVISRYTLRLLTSQQFWRAAMLVCACDFLRRQSTSSLGCAPISIGLWVGGNATPNTYDKAIEKAEDLRDGSEEGNPFQLDKCPWCGELLFPSGGRQAGGQTGVEVTNVSFKFFCLNEACPFKTDLPVSVVDEDLYQRPPTFLMGTVDKFAQLTWQEAPSVFFGDDDVMAPSLIIQDELHLLSGPLGTTVGLYESAIETVISLRGGIPPKVIASTATIRRAEEQCRALFGKGVRLFPAPGVDSRDGYFSEADPEKDGLLYLGLMSQSHRPTTTLIRMAAVLLQSINETDMSPPDRDLFSTLVIYHNSLRELGQTLTAAMDDIPAWIKVCASSQDRARVIEDDSVVELTSNRSAASIPNVLKGMATGFGQPGHISMLISSNMLSVGVDVQRLSMMLVNGQPKAASEYIQATNRVGRNDPGLVFTHYSPTKPRDRSHFESFLPFHAAAARYVEPTSATPFAAPSRDRALHAALVILIRHAVSGLRGNGQAGDFDPESGGVRAALEAFRSHIAVVDPREHHAAIVHFDRLVEDWDRRAQECRRARKPLLYSGGRQHEVLLSRFDMRESDGWRTLHSMRNVDQETLIDVAGRT